MKLSAAYFLLRPVQLNQEVHFRCAFVLHGLTVHIEDDDELDTVYSTQGRYNR